MRESFNYYLSSLNELSMNYLKNAVAIIFLIGVLNACGDKDKKNNKEKELDLKETDSKVTGKEKADRSTGGNLDGAWVIKRAEGNMKSMNIGTVYEFNGNKLTLGLEGFKNPGTTEITDSTFSFQTEGNNYKFMYQYKFNGDTLVVSVENSGGQVFHLVKE
jgi:hypothetical protein